MRKPLIFTAGRYQTVRLAELLFNLQTVEGMVDKLEQLRLGNVEATYAELEMGTFLARRGLPFRFVSPSGTKHLDYDVEIRLSSECQVNCEMKCKVEETPVSEGAVLNPLKKARNQLPEGTSGLVFLKVPEAWTRQGQKSAQIVSGAISSFLRNTSRIVAVILRWEEQVLVRDAALMLYKYRTIPNDRPSATFPDSIRGLVSLLDGPPRVPLVTFAEIAENACSDKSCLQSYCDLHL